MERIACDPNGDFLVRLIAHQDSLPRSLEKLQFYSGGFYGVLDYGAGLLACLSNKRGDDANHGDDMSKKFHGFKCQAPGCIGCQEFVNSL